MQEGPQIKTPPAEPAPVDLDMPVDNRPIQLPKRSHTRLWTSAVIIIILLILGLIIFALKQKVTHEQQPPPSVTNQAVDTSGLANSGSSLSVKNDKVTVNGQLQVNKSLVLIPSAQPSVN